MQEKSLRPDAAGVGGPSSEAARAEAAVFHPLPPGRLGERIGAGRTAEVYALGKGRVVKLFTDLRHRPRIVGEFEITNLAGLRGAPAWRVEALVQVRDRLGIVGERLEGPTLRRVLRRQPWRLGWVAGCLADLQAGFNAIAMPELPPLEGFLAGHLRRCGLPPAVEEPLRAWLAGRPAADTLCHGNLHLENVVLTGRGPVVLDWHDATCGPPAADALLTAELLCASLRPPAMSPAAWPARRLLRLIFLRRWLGAADLPAEALREWRALAFASRAPAMMDRRRAAAERRLLALLPRR